MRENKRKGMPTVKQLVVRHYEWLEKHFEGWFEDSHLKEYNYNYAKLYAQTCWACKLGFPVHYTFYRAHILPIWKGGSNDYTNIHLLCDECHKNSENLDGEPYWAWFHNRPNQPSVTFENGLSEAIRIQKLYESGNFDAIPYDFLLKLHAYYDEYRELRRYNEKYAYYHQVFGVPA
jgi:hypothetical protein